MSKSLYAPRQALPDGLGKDHPSHRSRMRGRQTGATTLIVVMVLFFVAALAAAYASRNLIFEQRTSANQYRATQSFEAAEAGMEWALVMLNSGRMNASCQPTTDSSFDSFRQRYLAINPNTGQVTPRFKSGGGFMWAACRLDGGAWACSCPNATENLAALSAGTAAFGVRFEYESLRPGMTRIEVNGCNGYDVACLTGEATSLAANCNATLCSLTMLAKAVRATPMAAVTARGAVSAGPGPLVITNTHTAAAGVTVQALSVGPLPPLTLQTTPGTPPAESVREGSEQFEGVAADGTNCFALRNCVTMFQSFFGTTAQAYRDQPGIAQLDCATGCIASQVNEALGLARGRVLWLSGPAGGLTISNNSDTIGTPTEPVVLVIEGALTVEASATASVTTRARIYGLVYAGTADISGGRIDGALVSNGAVTGNGTTVPPGEVVYDAAVLSRLRQVEGSFVRVPGSWRDFP